MDPILQLPHGRAVAENVGEVAGTDQRLLERRVLFFEPTVLERFADLGLQLGDVERLAQVVVGPQTQRLNGGLGRREGRDHDPDDLWVGLLRRTQHIHAAHVRHPDIGHEQIDRLTLQQIHRGTPALGEQHTVPFSLEDDG